MMLTGDKWVTILFAAWMWSLYDWAGELTVYGRWLRRTLEPALWVIGQAIRNVTQWARRSQA
jgi:hypothetical protein